jgi:hypothetical protein
MALFVVSTAETQLIPAHIQLCFGICQGFPQINYYLNQVIGSLKVYQQILVLMVLKKYLQLDIILFKKEVNKYVTNR